MIATEGGHWYTKNGEPFYEIEGKNGKMRPVTLRDARKLNLFPSVSTIIKEAYHPGLEIWKQKQVLMSALTLPRKKGESLDEFADRVLIDARHESETKRKIGTEIHAAIEQFFLYGDVQKDYAKHIRGAISALESIGVSAHNLHAEKSFSHPLGYGGKIDIQSKELQTVVDFKTKEFDENEKLNLYGNHEMQLSAYANGVNFDNPSMYIIFVSTIIPGLCKIVKHESYEKGLLMFKSLLSYYKFKNNYFPEVKS